MAALRNLSSRWLENEKTDFGSDQDDEEDDDEEAAVKKDPLSQPIRANCESSQSSKA